MSLCVDLNADLGEGAGHDEDILNSLVPPISPADFTPAIDIYPPIDSHRA